MAPVLEELLDEDEELEEEDVLEEELEDELEELLELDELVEEELELRIPEDELELEEELEFEEELELEEELGTLAGDLDFPLPQPAAPSRLMTVNSVNILDTIAISHFPYRLKASSIKLNRRKLNGAGCP